MTSTGYVGSVSINITSPYFLSYEVRLNYTFNNG